jgi:ubiquinone/menaquinone biosynthesis C-methylase UbiE
VTTSTGTEYDRIGLTYAETRREDPRIAQLVLASLGDASSVLNVGAGTGSYEPRDRPVVALDPSQVMLRQRPSGSSPVVCGRAERLPFPDGAVDTAMAILAIHHFDDREAGVEEMCRVARRRLVALVSDQRV